MIVYHGSTLEIQKPDIRHSKPFLDFGMGFYVTTFREQAERWAIRKAMRLSKMAIVNIYEMDNISSYKIKKFYDTDKDWLQFVCDCRNGKDIYKYFDIIIGSVANDDVFKCVNMYMDGIWDEERTLYELRFYKKNDQIALLNQHTIDKSLTFLNSYEIPK